MRSNYKFEVWKDDDIFKPKIKKKYLDFLDYLKNKGAIILETANTYEYLRFKIYGKTGLAYRNKFYKLSYFNDVCEQYYEYFIKEKVNQIECGKDNKKILVNKYYMEQKIKKLNQEIQQDEDYLEFLKDRLETLKKKRDELLG